MRSYNLVLDIGNTHIVLGIYQEKELVKSYRMNSDKYKTEDEYYILVKQLIEESIALNEIRITVICSVVPELERVFVHLVEKYLNSKFIIINSETELDLTFPMKDPSFIGSDLLINAYAARNLYEDNCIICDFGTATTVQLVGADGFFYGTTITPGVINSSAHLFKKASLISSVQLGIPKKILGTTTKDALLSGIINGNTFLIEGIIEHIKAEYSELKSFKVIATGGIAQLIYCNTDSIDIINKNLTLYGLNSIGNKQI